MFNPNCMKISTIFKLTLSLLLAGLLTGRAEAAESVRVPENRVIYECFVRNFSPEGTFKGVEKQVGRLADLGVDVIWLMPIYKLGDKDKIGSYSSPYAVKDYKAVNPDMGTEADLRSLIKAIHDAGMEVWFDWVGNHTSTDNVWVSSHPEYYGNKFIHPYGWNDVWQLDVNNAAMHDAMIDAMQYWVDNFDIDGYRCDYASGPTETFWSKATSRVLKNGKRIAWLAEDDSKPALVSKGYFDYNYAWAFHDRLLDFTGNGNVSNLRNACVELNSGSAYNGRSRMVYLSNHDVVQDKGGTEDRLFGKYLKPLTVLEFTVYGMPLLYNGQEIGYSSGAVSLGDKRPIDWSRPDTEMSALIKTLAEVKHTEPALRTGSQNGSFSPLQTDKDNTIFAYKRTSGNENVVVMLNLSNFTQTFNISGNLPKGIFRDVFSQRVVDFSKSSTFSLPAMGYSLWVSDPNGTPSGDDDIKEEISTIYVENKSGWNPLYLYAWANGEPELLGSWPGLKSTGTRTIDGREFLVFPMPRCEVRYNFIFNNNSGSQFDAFSFTPSQDKYVSITSSSSTDVQISSGLGVIGVDEEEGARYFTLTGLEVETPAPGNIYIRVSGTGKAVKVKF